MGKLHIRMLGAFEIGDENGASIALISRAKTLLAYLLLHRSAPQTRQHVAFVLFSNSTEIQARTNLRGLLRELRHALPDADRFVDTEGQNIQWRADAPCVMDAAEFEQAVAQAEQEVGSKNILLQRAALERAVERYRGELLPGYYEDWVLVERERLQQVYCDALAHLAGLLEAERNFRAALGVGQRLLRQDDLREDTYRLLMRLHALNGDRAAVARVFEQCVSKLRDNLGVEPSTETRRAYEYWRKFDPPLIDQPQAKTADSDRPLAPEPPPPAASAAEPESSPTPPPAQKLDPRLRYAKDALNYGLPAAGLTVSVVWLHAQVLVALPLSILAFLGLYFILNPRSASEEARADLRSDVLARLDECRAALGRIQALLPAVRKQAVKGQVGRIADLADGIIRKYTADEHTSLSKANSFEFFLSLIWKILDWYVRNGQVPDATGRDDLQSIVGKIEGGLLDEIESALKGLAARADQSGVADLDAAISLLKSVLKMEGLS